MRYPVTMTAPTKNFGDPTVIAIDIDITDGVIPNWRYSKPSETSAGSRPSSSTNHRDRNAWAQSSGRPLRAHRWQLAMSDICFDRRDPHSASSPARCARTLTTVFAAEQRLTRFAARCQKARLHEDRNGDDDYLIYTRSGTTSSPVTKAKNRFFQSPSPYRRGLFSYHFLTNSERPK